MPKSSNIPGGLIWFPNRGTIKLIVATGKEVKECGPNKMEKQLKFRQLRVSLYLVSCYYSGW